LLKYTFGSYFLFAILSFCINIDTGNLWSEVRSYQILDHKGSFVYACLCSLCIKAGEFQWRFSLLLELTWTRPIFTIIIKILSTTTSTLLVLALSYIRPTSLSHMLDFCKTLFIQIIPVLSGTIMCGMSAG